MRLRWFDWSPAWYVLTLETGDHNQHKGKKAAGSGTDWQENGQGGGMLPIFTQLLSSTVAGARRGSGPCIRTAWVWENVSVLLHLLQCPLQTASPVMVSAVGLGKQEWDNWQSPLTPLPGVEYTFHLHQNHQQEEHVRTGELKHLGHSNYIFKALGDLDSCVSPDAPGLCSPVHKRHILKPF